MTKAHMLEKDVKKEVKKLLDKHKWFWFMPPANGFGQTGISDFIALRDGVFMAVETKLGTRKPTLMQVGFLQSIAANDGFAFVITERNMNVFATWMEAFDNSVKDASHKLPPAQEDGAAMLNAMRELTGGLL